MIGWSEDFSPFHRGEKAMHKRLGIEERQETMGRRMMRRFMPDQHRVFFAQLPFAVLGSVDRDGAPWASIIPGHPGFIETPTDRTMRINARPLAGDPLSDGVLGNAPVSLLGIEPHTRRRNRANLRVERTDEEGMDLRVTMSFGNCPQYIHTRKADWRDKAKTDPIKDKIDGLSDEAQALIRASDTFFVASHNHEDSADDIGGVDVNHRGGKPGFVQISGDTLTIPDYRGNNAFNTLGNFEINPKAGLTFIDFKSGDLLQMTGNVTVLHDADEAATDLKGAQRSWEFRFAAGHFLRAAVPPNWQFGTPL